VSGNDVQLSVSYETNSLPIHLRNVIERSRSLLRKKEEQLYEEGYIFFLYRITGYITFSRSPHSCKCSANSAGPFKEV
jgi:hypothetical protein